MEVQAKRSSTDEPRAQYVTEIMERDAEEAARPAPRVKRRSWVPALAVLLPVFILLTAWNVFRMSRDPEVFPAGLEHDAARFVIYLVAQEIESYMDSATALPASLEEIGLEEDDVEYVRSGSTYTLATYVGSTQITYRSGEDLDPLWNAFDRLQGGIVQ